MRALRQHALAVDAAIATAFVAVAEVEALLGLTTRDEWVHSLLAPLFLAPLALRRRAPLLALAAAVAGLVALDPEVALSFFGAVVLAAYTAGATLDAPQTYAAPALALVPFLALVAAGAAAPSDLVAFLLFFAGPWAVGRLLRLRLAHVREVARLTERAAIEEERARIARELHDIVSHAISVVTVQTQAVRRRLGPEHAREADDLRAVEATAREAMADLRRLFGVLRADGEAPSLAPQPGLGELERLLEQTRAAGLAVELEIEGAAGPLPPGADLAAYRVVQEALTNVRRHARASRATVRLRFGGDRLEIVVDDDGVGAGATGDGGHGLVGMRERLVLYGGELETGPRPGGGFRVRATLPLRTAP
jgi:signal transduction histidine kinase